MLFRTWSVLVSDRLQGIKFEGVVVPACVQCQLGKGSEDGHLFWFCHSGGTISIYFVKFAPGQVRFSPKIGNA